MTKYSEEQLVSVKELSPGSSLTLPTGGRNPSEVVAPYYAAARELRVDVSHTTNSPAKTVTIKRIRGVR